MKADIVVKVAGEKKRQRNTKDNKKKETLNKLLTKTKQFDIVITVASEK